MRTRCSALVAALAVSLLLVPSGSAGAASSGMVPRGRPVWVSLARPVAVVAAGGTGGAGQVSVTEGAVGFPISVATTGATGTSGAVPAGACVSLDAHGQQVAAGKADDHGRFALTGAVPRGAIATIRWSPCSSQGGETDPKNCHNRIPHQRNQNRDEARSQGQGCSTAGDAGPDS